MHFGQEKRENVDVKACDMKIDLSDPWDLTMATSRPWDLPLT